MRYRMDNSTKNTYIITAETSTGTINIATITRKPEGTAMLYTVVEGFCEGRTAYSRIELQNAVKEAFKKAQRKNRIKMKRMSNGWYTYTDHHRNVWNVERWAHNAWMVFKNNTTKYTACMGSKADAVDYITKHIDAVQTGA